MSAPTLLLWVILPYVSLTIFVAGHVWRYRRDQFGWTTRSTQLHERRLLKWGSPLFHYGVLAAVGGHVIGLLVPESFTRAIGVPEWLYRDFSATAGTLASVAIVAGLAILLYRRVADPRVAATTTRIDVAMYLLMVAIIALGIVETVGVNLIGGGYDYRATVALWFRGIFAAHPDPSLMTSAPLVYQLHAILAWAFLALWPFTRLVHAWSAPVWYLWRPFVLYRRARAGGRVPRRGRAPVEVGAMGPAREVER